MTAPDTTTAHPVLDRKPRDEEIDVYGLTHRGKVRTENQDHFPICALRKQMAVHSTSLPETDSLMATPERLAFLAMVADGVGGGAKGADASRIALEAVTRYVSHSMHCYYATGSADDRELSEALQKGALECHAELRRRGEEDAQYRGMATTLTLFLGVWPKAYLLQVGDSRCYLLRSGELTQVTRDQTMAQDLVDLGVMKQKSRPRRADPGPAPFDDLCQTSMRGSAAGGSRGRRKRQYHHRNRTSPPQRPPGLIIARTPRCSLVP